MDFATSVFGIETQEIKIVDRGLEFPRNIPAVTSFLTEERQQLRI